MSTYYSLVCDKCKEETSFVGRWFPDMWGWMADARDVVPLFVQKHEPCLGSLRVISEHDDRYGEYSEFDPGADVVPNDAA